MARKGQKSITFYMPRETYEEIKSTAEALNRSITSYLLYLHDKEVNREDNMEHKLDEILQLLQGESRSFTPLSAPTEEHGPGGMKTLATGTENNELGVSGVSTLTTIAKQTDVSNRQFVNQLTQQSQEFEQILYLTRDLLDSLRTERQRINYTAILKLLLDNVDFGISLQDARNATSSVAKGVLDDLIQVKVAEKRRKRYYLSDRVRKSLKSNPFQ